MSGAAVKHKFCRILRRCNLHFMLVFLFVASSISVFVTYLYVNVVFDDFNDESKESHLHFEKRNDNVLVNIEADDDDADVVYRRVNLIVDRIINTRSFEINGWWMSSSSSWTTAIDCNTGAMGICSKTLSVQCKQDDVRAVYQYLPFQQHSNVRGLYFSAKSSANDMQEDTKFVQSSMYSAIALLKFKDGITQRLRLDYPGGTHSYILSEIETILINDKVLASIMVVLGCYGYDGVARFMDVTVTPMEDGDTNTVRGSSNHLLSRCPRNIIEKRKEDFEQEVMISHGQNGGMITLATQLSMDDIQLLKRLGDQWHDELSVALYVPTKSNSKDGGHQWQRLYINKKIKPLEDTQSRISLTAVFANTVNEEYPGNSLRNAAVRQSTNNFIFILDADFLPSLHFKENILKWVELVRVGGNMAKTAFVVPVFEFQEGAKETIPPDSKEELVKDIYDPDGSISPYQYSEKPEAHRPTNYPVWYRSKEPYKVTGYQDQYEPYVILKKTPSLPEHDERFSGSSFGRAAFTMELKAAGYEFLVLPDVWAIHVPHHRQNLRSASLLEDPPRLQDHLRRFEFVSGLLTKYIIGRCKQGSHEAGDKRKPGRVP